MLLLKSNSHWENMMMSFDVQTSLECEFFFFIIKKILFSSNIGFCRIRFLFNGEPYTEHKKRWCSKRCLSTKGWWRVNVWGKKNLRKQQYEKKMKTPKNKTSEKSGDFLPEIGDFRIDRDKFLLPIYYYIFFII